VTATPWAFSLFKFSDDDHEPQTLEFYETNSWGSTRHALISGEATDLGGLANEMGHG
jgi:hypothetical protein